MLDRLRALLPTLVGTPGRPHKAPVNDEKRWAVITAVRDFALMHPGCVYLVDQRRKYSEEFRRFVVGLLAAGEPAADMSMAELSETTSVPMGTLKEWLATTVDTPLSGSADVNDAWPLTIISSTNLQLVVRLWRVWKGSFQAFCTMLRTEHRLPYGATYVGDFLEALGERKRRRRMPVEPPWSSNTFRTFFPGAQWIGDGTDIGVHWGGEFFVFNLEAIIDAASNAMVGIAVSDTENEEVLRRAYMSALETTGAAAAGITLDNKLSNHSPEAKAGMPGAVVLQSTLGRGQSKAPIEGAFGLFQQAMPPLVVTGRTAREMACSFLYTVCTAWFRGRNGKPRTKLHGRSPADVYAASRPTPEEFQKVLAYFRELERRQEQMRLTREARLDPVRIALLTQGLEELGIADPDHRFALALAGFSREAIIYGLSVFAGKQKLGKLPLDADGRYLGGIIRNHDSKLELLHFSAHILQQRLRLRDLSLAPLQQAESQIRTSVPPENLTQTFVDRALTATYAIDFRFWAKTAANALSVHERREDLYKELCRRTAASFKADRERREELIVHLATATVPP